MNRLVVFALIGVVVFSLKTARGEAVARIGATEYDSLVGAIQSSQADDVIELLSDVSESFAESAQSSLAPISHNLTITSADGVRREVYATNTKGYSFQVSGGTLTLSNVVLRSASRSTSSYDMYLFANGTGSKVVFGEGFLMSGITNVGGHAVCYWSSSAKLDMLPGAEVRALYANYGHLRFSSSTFNLSGGVISDCVSRNGEGSPVYLSGGTLNMTGGTITRCRCNSSTAASGAVFLHHDYTAHANLSGGVISNNFVRGIWANATTVSRTDIKLGGDFRAVDNFGGDMCFVTDGGLSLASDFSGLVSITNKNTAGLPVAGAAVGTNADWYRGASNIRFAGDDTWQLFTSAEGKLVWGTKPVRIGETYYRTLYEAMAAAPETANFEIVCDNPEFDGQIVRTNVNWRFTGVGGQRILTWPKTDYPFYFRNSELTLNGVLLTALKQLSTSRVSKLGKQYFLNLAGGRLVLEDGGGVTNVYAANHAVLGLGYSGISGSSVGGTTLVMEPGSVLADLSSNYGAVRFEGGDALFLMNGGRISGCSARNQEGSPVYFLGGGRMTMRGGVITGNRCTVASSVSGNKCATIWNNNENGNPFCLELLGGEISGNQNSFDFKHNTAKSVAATSFVRLGGSATVGGPGLCVVRANGGGVMLSAAGDYAGSCVFCAGDGYLPDPAATTVLGDMPVSALSHLTWSNAGDHADYRLASIGGLGAFVPVGVPDDEAFGDSSVWGGKTGFGTDLHAAVSASSGGVPVYLLRDWTLTGPLGTLTASYVLDGLGHTITCDATNFLNQIRAPVTIRNVTVTGNRRRNEVSYQGTLTLGKGFVFRDFAGVDGNGSSYASFSLDSTGCIVIEDGAVIEDGLSQVGVFRLDGASARLVMNGGVIRSIGFDATSRWRGEGAALNILSGTFEMNGGVISNCLWNAAAQNPDFRGAVYFNPSDTFKSFRMTGGRIVGNTAGVWCDTTATIAVEGSATIAANAVRDLHVTRSDVLKQTGDLTGEVFVTAPFDGLETVFGRWEAGTGAERFRHGLSKFGKVVDGNLVWDMDRRGIILIVR